jgi:hypothetical protein
VEPVARHRAVPYGPGLQDPDYGERLSPRRLPHRASFDLEGSTTRREEPPGFGRAGGQGGRGYYCHRAVEPLLSLHLFLTLTKPLLPIYQNQVRKTVYPEWFIAKPITRLGGPGLIPVSFIEIRDMTTASRATFRTRTR